MLNRMASAMIARSPGRKASNRDSMLLLTFATRITV